MKALCSFISLALVSATRASTQEMLNPKYTTTMSPQEAAAFREVALYCEKDIHDLCDGSRSNSHDPWESILSLAMPPTPPSFNEVESFIDGVFYSSLFVSSSKDSTGSFLFIVEHGPTLEERTVQHVLTEIAGQTPVEEIPSTAKRIAEHGSLLLDNTPDSSSGTEIRVARRLSEVTEQDLQQRKQSLLPFGAMHAECLRGAYASSLLSLPCGRSIYRLDQVRGALYLANLKFQRDSASVMVNLICLYALVLATGMVIYWRRRRDAKAKRRLTKKIFRAIYSKPHLKEAVEREMGESVGHVPPLPSPTLWRMGLLGKQLKGVFRTFRLLRLASVSIVCIFFILAPLSTLPFVVGYSMVVFWSAAFAPKPVDICACCCCSATTQDAKDGTLTAEQACCACCSGTGICSVQCASCCEKGGVKSNCSPGGDEVNGCCDGCCCGDKTEGCCDECSCCDACSCCCSSSDGDELKKCGSCPMNDSDQPKLVVYEGIPVQIV